MNKPDTVISDKLRKFDNLEEITEVYEVSDDDTYRDCLMFDGRSEEHTSELQSRI